ncbi:MULTISPECIES: glycoside hydrolase family protein [unclassified Cyanobium]|uniref:glycoside hydrolase family protein n=1 Tax=unclassified Cyanobium TaxID=2627006 RepID=UPI0020CDB01D|nr:MULTISPECIES: glycoside hydrolase family protein [unclassified Cyanobium]MCP9857943.1 glycoside hydrolase family protein [Cyanobium sp. Cruz-8H5]MCP9865000.1 glycoside hydrolase family protein [Cyanobium sp. Cruz-8D1]
MSKAPLQGKPPVPTSNYVSHYDPSKSHHRAWLQAVLDLLVQHEPEALAEGSELRDLWKAAVETKAPTEIPAAVAVAMPLVKEFEGCKLTAYPDPETGAEPWTIGWGSTTYDDGAPVKRGDRISQELADALLAGRLKRDHQLLAQRIPGWAKLSTNQQAALLSFTYNCGPAWFGSKGFTTITKVLQAGELEKVPAALMLYVNPGGPSEAGLRRRRKAEAALWSASPSRLNSKPPAGGGAIRHPNPLVGVPRYSQRDSAQLSQRDRTCFSSSCAMLLETIKPGTLKGAHGDDHYLAVVQRFGDTTDASAQLRALAHYGVTARLVQNADFQMIEQQINRGIPVPCGYIHRGHVDRPTGSGHWLIVYGHTPTHVVVNDPWGEPDLISGATLNAKGMGLQFSRLNFGKRWMVEPISGGAYRYAPGRGWSIVVDRLA